MLSSYSSPDAMTLVIVVVVEESGWSDIPCLKRVRGAVAAGYLRIQLPPLSIVVKLVAAAETSLPLGYSTAMPTAIGTKRQHCKPMKTTPSTGHIPLPRTLRLRQSKHSWDTHHPSHQGCDFHEFRDGQLL